MGLKGLGLLMEAAPVVPVWDQLAAPLLLPALPDLLRVARGTLRIVRWDPVPATGIHLIAAVLALAHRLGVAGSASVHQVSSALVLLNTLRLIRLSPKALVPQSNGQLKSCAIAVFAARRRTALCHPGLADRRATRRLPVPPRAVSSLVFPVSGENRPRKLKALNRKP